jgi:phasin family protein
MDDFGEFGKPFADIKLPDMPDMKAFVAASRRNMETLAAVSRIAMEGARAVGRRHMEIEQQRMAELTEALRAMSSVEAPQAKAARQAELLKQAYERAASDMKEFSDLLQHSTAEAVALLNARIVVALSEIRLLASQKPAGPPLILGAPADDVD